MKYLLIIERYFLGQLKDQELRNFLTELHVNSDLRDEFNVYKKAFDFVNTQENEIKKNIKRMKDFEFEADVFLDINKYGKDSIFGKDVNKHFEIPNSYRVDWFYRWRNIAAIALLVLGLGISGVIISSKTFDEEALFKNHYSPYGHSYLKRSTNIEYNNFLLSGITLYDQGRYKQALSELEKIPTAEIDNDEVFILKGNCNMELRQFSEAIREFKNIDSNSLLYTTSLWYQGLSYLMLNDKRNARLAFQELKAYKFFYQKETRKLLKRL